LPAKYDEAAPDVPEEQQAPPPDPDPVPKPKTKGKSRKVTSMEAPRWSAHQRKVPSNPNNVYRDKPPSKVVHDIGQLHSWQKMIENQLGSSQDDNSQDQLVPGEFPEQTSDPPTIQSNQLHELEDEVEQQLLICLAKEGGVKFLDALLAKAVVLTNLGSPNTLNIIKTFLRCLQTHRRSGNLHVARS
jgi:hypothetical protein